jgi:hypothetical protein
VNSIAYNKLRQHVCKIAGKNYIGLAEGDFAYRALTANNFMADSSMLSCVYETRTPDRNVIYYGMFWFLVRIDSKVIQLGDEFLLLGRHINLKCTVSKVKPVDVMGQLDGLLIGLKPFREDFGRIREAAHNGVFLPLGFSFDEAAETQNASLPASDEEIDKFWELANSILGNITKKEVA